MICSDEGVLARLVHAKLQLADAAERREQLRHEIHLLRQRAATAAAARDAGGAGVDPNRARSEALDRTELCNSAWALDDDDAEEAAVDTPRSRRERIREKHGRYLEKLRERQRERAEKKDQRRKAREARRNGSRGSAALRSPQRPSTTSMAPPNAWAAVNMVVSADEDVTSNVLLVVARAHQRALHLAIERERCAVATLRRAAAAAAAPTAGDAQLSPRALRCVALFLGVRTIVGAGAVCTRWRRALSPAARGSARGAARCSELWCALAQRGVAAAERGAFWRIALFHSERCAPGLFPRTGVFRRLESCAAPLYELTDALQKLSRNTHEQRCAGTSAERLAVLSARELELLNRAAVLERVVHEVYAAATRSAPALSGDATAQKEMRARFSLTHGEAAAGGAGDEAGARAREGAASAAASANVAAPGGGGGDAKESGEDDGALAVVEIQRWIAPLSLITVDLRRTYGCGHAAWLDADKGATPLASSWWEFGDGSDPMQIASSAAQYVGEAVREHAAARETSGAKEEGEAKAVAAADAAAREVAAAGTAAVASEGHAAEGFDAIGAGRERQLRNVLCALILYFRRNDALAAIGYCQGMNFVAAMLLRHMGSADAFWAMVALLQSDRCVA